MQAIIVHSLLLFGIFNETTYVLLSSNEAITYSENGWISLGGIGGEGQNKSLYIQQDTGTPCVAYMDQNLNTGYVDKYNSETWEHIGNPTAYHFDTLLKDGYGNISLGWWNGEIPTAPIVAYRKNDGNIYVKKLYKDVNFYWDNLGNNPIGYCQDPLTNAYKGIVSLVVVTTSVSPPKGKVYVAFRDGNNGGKVTVKACAIDNPVWEIVGGGPASASAAEYINLIVLNNVPYIAYKDYANGGKITVRKYE